MSRRNLWRTINEIKRNKVVVLTTHNLEEADFLADNIMILHSGTVKGNIISPAATGPSAFFSPYPSCPYMMWGSF